MTRQIRDLADPVQVSSAGVLDAGLPVPEEVSEVMAPFGIDLSGHRSQRMTASLLKSCDLVVGMGRRHVQEAVLLDPPCWPQAFTFKELVRRGEEVGARRPDQGVRSWIESVQGDRSRASLARRSTAEDIADPYGKPLDQYASTVAELAHLTSRLAGLLWPDEVGYSM